MKFSTLKMSTLGEIPHIAKSIKWASAASVKLLHQFLFGNDCGRSNRKNIRMFSGIPSDFDVEKAKKVALGSFTLSDFVRMCEFLGLECFDTPEKCFSAIIKALSDLKSLKPAVHSDSESDDENELKDNLVNPVTLDADPVMSNTFDGSNLTFNFRDLSDLIRPFSGSNNFSVKVFFDELDEFFSVYNVTNNIQKLIFLKKCLINPAKLYVQSLRNVKTYEKLRDALFEEFDSRVTSIDLHNLLQKRKLKSNESLQDYFFSVRELASRGNIDEASVIEYVINGIPDPVNNKIILYGCKSLAELKEKLRIYEKLRLPRSDGNHTPTPVVQQRRQSNNPPVICFNCGGKNHRSPDCPNRERGPKCFACKGFGHKSRDCPRNGSSNQTSSTPGTNHVTKVVQYEPNVMQIQVSISDVLLNALLDTGSSATIVKESVYRSVGSPDLLPSPVSFIGFGSNRVSSAGYFVGVILIESSPFHTNIHVVPDDCLSFDVIIGNDCIRQAEFFIGKHGIKLVGEDSYPLGHLVNLVDMESVDISNITNAGTRSSLLKLLQGYSPRNPPKLTNIKLRINLINDTPIFHSPRRLPFTEREVVEKQVNEWLRDGVIEPCASDYASQVVVVRRKDGSPRVCVDYRRLNRVISKDHYPLPLIEDTLDELQDARVFSTLDLKNGFHHVEVDPQSRPYTSFVTHNSQYQFIRMPFGLSTCPAVFQRFINAIFHDLIKSKIVLPYLDDLIILANDDGEAIERLKVVLNRASEYGLNLNFKKCQFLQRRIEFLGHIVENGTVRPSPSKVKALVNYPEPRNQKDIQKFLGLSNYFRKFIPSYSTIAKPLSDLLRKDTPFVFLEREKSAFLKLKQRLCEDPVLAIFRQGAETEVHCDASMEGFGSILLQKGLDGSFHPVFYHSRKTTDAQRKLSSYELEVLAVIDALQKFRTYILGQHFKIITDCDAFTKTMAKREVSSKIARWALLLQDYDYVIEHRSGTRMTHVDALSRICVVTLPADPFISRLKLAQQRDPFIQKICGQIAEGSSTDFIVKNGILFKLVEGTDLFVVPDSMELEIIRNAHNNGHFAVKRTEDHIKQKYFIPNLKVKIEKYIDTCVPCLLANRKRGKGEGFLHPLEKDDTPFHTYHIDHLGPLASSNKNYKYILAVIDSFTKFCWLYPCKSTSSREVISKLEIQKSVFGNPIRIITDRGTSFTSDEFKQYCEGEGVLLHHVTTGLPRANGQVERLNRTIISVITKLTQTDPAQWYKYVSSVQQVINSTFNRSIGTNPFQLLTGTGMNSKTDYRIKELIEEEILNNFQNNRDELRLKAKEAIQKIQTENRHSYNLRRKKPNKYNVNDMVLVKRTQATPGSKFGSKFLGP